MLEFSDTTKAKALILRSLGTISLDSILIIFLGSYTVAKAFTASLASFLAQPAAISCPKIISPLDRLSSFIN